MKTHNRLRLRQARKGRIRKSLNNAAGRPRLSVFRSSKHIYAQIVNDAERKTLVAASSQSKELKGQIKHGGNLEAAKLVGSLLGDKAAQAGIQEVVYDRNGFIFAGRVKALADAVREKGVKF